MARRHADLAAAKQPVAPSTAPGPDPPQRGSFNMEPTWLQVLEEEVEADEISSAQLMEDLAAEKRLSKHLAAEDHLAWGGPRPPGPIDHVDSGAPAWANTSVELAEPSPIYTGSEAENPREKDDVDHGTVTANTALPADAPAFSQAAEEEAPSQGFKQVSAADLAALGFEEPPSPASQLGDDANEAWLQLLEEEVDASCKATTELLAEDGGEECGPSEEKRAELLAEEAVSTGSGDCPRDVSGDVRRDAAAQDDLTQAPSSPNLSPSPPLDDSDEEEYYETRCETPKKPGWRIRLEAQLAEKEKEFGEKPRNSMEMRDTEASMK